MSETAAVAYGQIVGRRSRQEDSCLHTTRGNASNGEPEIDLMVLADGMGGHIGGDVAAPLVCEAFRRQVMDEWDGGESGFLSGLDAATRAIAAAIRKNEDYAEMGSTLLGATIREGRLRWISIGDSLLYHFDGETLRRINADHSMGSVLDAACRRGEISEEEARTSSQRNVLLSAVTASPASRVDLSTDGLLLRTGDVVIVASDGLGVLSDEEIARIAAEPGAPEEICEKLLSRVEAANHPKQDNTTVIVARILGEPADEADSIPTRPLRARAR